MIIIRLVGGLGNQMFQYAMASSVARRTGKKLKLDLSWIRQTEKALESDDIYGLGIFSFEERFSSSDEVCSFLPSHKFLIKAWRAANLIIPFPWRRVIEEREMGWHPEVMEIRRSVYFYMGYWQSEKYFSDFAQEIRKDFTFREEIRRSIEERRPIVEKIRKCNAISLHIRRGDYAQNPKLGEIFLSFTMQYYVDAARYIAERVTDPIFFVFSDDIPWVKENLQIPYDVCYIDDNVQTDEKEIGHKSKGYEDMYLMTQCKHNIIANSSFSWWGAWLNDNPDKIVIAPEKWCNGSFNYADIVPEQWVKL
jgi:glycosyltransferase, family 11